MPHIYLRDPYGMGYQISTTRIDTLRQWFQEILPRVNADQARNPEMIAVIMVQPMWRSDLGSSVDWHTDSKVTGRQYPFAAIDGDSGITMLETLRAQLQSEINEETLRRG